MIRKHIRRIEAIKFSLRFFFLKIYIHMYEYMYCGCVVAIKILISYTLQYFFNIDSV